MRITHVCQVIEEHMGEGNRLTALIEPLSTSY